MDILTQPKNQHVDVLSMWGSSDTILLDVNGEIAYLTAEEARSLAFKLTLNAERAEAKKRASL